MLFALVLIAASLPFSSSACPVRSCVNAGQLCGSTQIDYTIGCNGYTICNTTWGDTISNVGTCIPIIGPGQPCGGAELCVEGYTCGASNICVVDTRVPAVFPGAPCTNNSQCYFMGDDENVVRSCEQGICRFIADGQSCRFVGVQCNTLTSVCNLASQVCQPYIPLGAPCIVAQAAGCRDTCVPTTTTTVNGTCANFQSVAAGQPCQLDFQCVEGLYCAPVQSGYLFGVCSAVVNTSTLHQPCNNDTDCTAANREYCGCFSKYGNSSVCLVDIIPPGYTAAQKAFETCARVCELSNGDYNSSCVLSRCLRERCTYVQLANSISDVFNGCFTQSVLHPLCAALDSTTSTTSTTSSSSSSLSSSTSTQSSLTSSTSTAASTTSSLTSSTSSTSFTSFASSYNITISHSFILVPSLAVMSILLVVLLAT